MDNCIETSLNKLKLERKIIRLRSMLRNAYMFLYASEDENSANLEEAIYEELNGDVCV
jgi:PhoPQ-activated pathogenicity-related protein